MTELEQALCTQDPLDRCLLASANMNEHNDCGVRAAALVCNVPYETAHVALRVAGRQPRQGSFVPQITKAVKSLGCTVHKSQNPKQPNGSRYTAKTLPKAYPRGRFLVYTRDHVFAMIDGTVLDWAKGRRLHVVSIQEVTTC